MRLFKTKNYYKKEVEYFESHVKRLLIKIPLIPDKENLQLALYLIDKTELYGIEEIKFNEELNFLGLTTSYFQDFKLNSVIELSTQLFWLPTLFHEIAHHLTLKKYGQKTHSRRFYKENLKLLRTNFLTVFNKIKIQQEKKLSFEPAEF